MVAPDNEVVRPRDPTVFTPCTSLDIPDIVTPDQGAGPDRVGILKPGNEDPCRSAVRTDNLRLRGDCFYDLVDILAAVVAAGAVPGEDEPLTHA
jgi:hypothetical protein